MRGEMPPRLLGQQVRPSRWPRFDTVYPRFRQPIKLEQAACQGAAQRLDGAGGGVPDDFVELQAEAGGDAVFEHPFDERAGFEAFPLAVRIVGDR